MRRSRSWCSGWPPAAAPVPRRTVRSRRRVRRRLPRRRPQRPLCTDYEACFDATCEVIVETGTEIELDAGLGWTTPDGLELDGWSLLTVDDVADGSIGLSLSGEGPSSGGATSTILTADGTEYYLDGMSVDAVAAPDDQVVLNLSWG